MVSESDYRTCTANARRFETQAQMGLPRNGSSDFLSNPNTLPTPIGLRGDDAIRVRAALNLHSEQPFRSAKNRRKLTAQDATPTVSRIFQLLVNIQKLGIAHSQYQEALH